MNPHLNTSYGICILLYTKMLRKTHIDEYGCWMHIGLKIPFWERLSWMTVNPGSCQLLVIGFTGASTKMVMNGMVGGKKSLLLGSSWHVVISCFFWVEIRQYIRLSKEHILDFRFSKKQEWTKIGASGLYDDSFARMTMPGGWFLQFKKAYGKFPRIGDSLILTGILIFGCLRIRYTSQMEMKKIHIIELLCFSSAWGSLQRGYWSSDRNSPLWGKICDGWVESPGSPLPWKKYKDASFLVCGFNHGFYVPWYMG